MLDVHPAHHAANTWREFFIHIATIVVGLLIAVGLEQTVELIHHAHEVSQLQEELKDERQANHRAVSKGTSYWRWETVELKSNLRFLAFLRDHPKTTDEKLPGSLVWSYGREPRNEAVWNAAKANGVTALMKREEIEQYEDYYNKLRDIDDAQVQAWNAVNDASRYEFSSGRLSDLTPLEVSDFIGLTEIALEKHWLLGVALENLASKYPDFAPSISAAELDAAKNREDFFKRMKNPAFADTISRMRAAGYGQ